jgi:hypothetical protein
MIRTGSLLIKGGFNLERSSRHAIIQKKCKETYSIA